MMHRQGYKAAGRYCCAPFIFTSLAMFGACATTSTQPASTRDMEVQPVASVRAEVKAMVDSSAHAWNRGDLDGFVAYYDTSMSTTFVGRREILRGPVAIKKVYASRFVPGVLRDSLSFENMEIDLLSPDAVNVIAYYKLMRGDSTTAHGPTSLVMRKRNGAWRIVHDHSS